ncbi:hypothetical protein [Mycobacterium terramassiliense]|uniref:Uncharacterized protein n=1 Tax=Mycobacterium terramassiliense TaxID=1841859 RepID=A0A2U3N669_9MYCO|nr:hypothetical protein [Mycobacterium terramassiliense]SPM27008.1 hypothetical protein MTAB308_483 [Mycobacterium terramassiliense]
MASAAARRLPAVIAAVGLTLSVASPGALAQPPDYTELLIRATDLAAPQTFMAAPPINNPNGQPGATATFRDRDRTHVIVDSVQILPDPTAAARALESAKATTDGYVHGIPEANAVGTGGTTISGPSPDGSKSVTVLMFTEGRAFAELEFDGPPDDLVAPDFVADVGTKQDAAIKRGLTG